MDHVRRLGGFVLLPAMSMLASLVLLPVIADIYGSQGWVTLALGQSIGAITSVVVSLAWPVIGGHLIASATTDVDRRAIFRSSVVSRVLMLGLLLLPAIPVTAALSGSFPLETVLFMIGIAGTGLTASWYFAGTGEPRHVVINEGLVRLGAYALSLGGLLLGFGLIWYASLMALSGFAMLVLNWRQIMRGEPIRIPGQIREGWTAIGAQLSGTASRVLQALFAFGGPSIFSAFAPGALVTYSALDQVQKAAGNALGVAPMAFVSWVGSAAPRERARRMGWSMVVIFGVAAAAALTWALSGPFVLRLLFAGELTVSTAIHVLLILSVVTVLLCRSSEFLVMVPLGFQRSIYVANSVVSVLGLIAIAIAAVLYGAVGGLAVWVACHTALLLYYASKVIARRFTAS